MKNGIHHNDCNHCVNNKNLVRVLKLGIIRAFLDFSNQTTTYLEVLSNKLEYILVFSIDCKILLPKMSIIVY